jgi:hypothetical protein
MRWMTWRAVFDRPRHMREAVRGAVRRPRLRRPLIPRPLPAVRRGGARAQRQRHGR